MSRAVLDPAARGAPAGQISLDRAPMPIRDTGVYPDIGALQPGDLVLVSPLKPSFTARMIQRVQGQVHKAEDAEWMHAALYLGDNAIIEIDGGGVQVNLLFRYVLTHRLLFRRVLDGQAAPIDEITGYRIAIAALKQFRRGYAHANIVVTGWDCLFSQTKPATQRAVRSKGSICSDFFNEAVFATTGRVAAPVDRLPLQPADLSASRLMRDVGVGWAALA